MPDSPNRSPGAVMNSHTTHRFRELLAALPAHVQQQAREAYTIFEQNPAHPGLHFKQVDSGPLPVYSVRVGIGVRAVGTLGIVPGSPVFVLRRLPG